MSSLDVPGPTVVEQSRSLKPPIDEATPRSAPESLPTSRFRVISSPKTLPTEPITIQFRTRRIRATAAKVEKEIPNVFLLQVTPSIAEQRMNVAVGCLPPRLRRFFDKCFPEWSLPNRLVLKACKPKWDEEFETEKSTYAALKKLQGTRIPRYFGALTYQGTKAILLSDIGGAHVGEPAGAVLDKAQFRQLMKDTLSDMARHGALPDDIRLENFHIVGDKVMAVDFEMVNKVTSDNSCIEIQELTEWLADLYANRQQDLFNSGKIEET
ncbi:hypothetical protein C2857_000049 [Epichloe festucae Fl1]|uniref:Uncharacterized protein n=1 Tax=Epichloe festucae (strain Fl1) TaxID=877507 RepID=A0A7U3Q0Y0_EPIFF|nr:hypothetical protein C2857_000049 [Epichloe festucae Fl1]